MTENKKRKIIHQNKKLLTYLFVVFLSASIAFLWLAAGKNTNQASNKPPQSTIPSETPINDKTYKWRGKPEDPKYIQLPTINSGGFIEKMDIDKENQIESPGNISLAGWYVYSKRPGQVGVSIIDGHVDGTSKPGIFFKLKDLKKGNVFTVEFGNGKIEKFSVKSLIIIDAKKAVEKLFYKDPSIERQLNLITCGGSFDRITHSYSKRIIVFSEAI